MLNKLYLPILPLPECTKDTPLFFGDFVPTGRRLVLLEKCLHQVILVVLQTPTQDL